ncbi:MAG: PEP-CTERM sorting domain-containing protein [Pirellulales bacterium]
MKSQFLLVALTVICLPAIAHAHGLPFRFNVDQSNDFYSINHVYYEPVLEPVEQHDSVFEPGSYTVNAVTTNSLQWLGAFTPVPPAPNGNGQLAVGSTYRFDVVGPLLFWDPVLGITPTSETLTIVRSGLGVAVDQNTGVLAGLNLTVPPTGYNGTATFHNSASFNLPLSAAPGLYAVGLQIVSTNTTTYGSSGTFYAIGINNLSAEDVQQGIEDFAAIGVPEPSSVVLLAGGLAGAAVFGWRRRRVLRGSA